MRVPLAQKTEELQDILQALDSLQSRVKELTGPEATVPAQAAPQEPAAGLPDLEPDELPTVRGNLSADHLSLLKLGVQELNRLSKLKDFPLFFDRLAEKTGLRMVLLKRWTSGLQVFMERNIKMPGEAKRKRRDGRAPIPCQKGDLFSAVGDEATVYCGPVPVKHFPLDLTLMLGRGSKDRQIIVLPLPSQNHWNTFLYLDADRSGEQVLAIAEVLAHFALSRMCLLNKGLRVPQGRVAAILKSEIYRRKEAGARRDGRLQQDRSEQQAEGPATAADDQTADDIEFVSPPAAAGNKTQDTAPPPQIEVDPFVVQEITPAAGKPANGQIPLAPEKPLRAATGTTADLPDSDPEAERGRLTPEGVLHHSGELPALPKAACHIMAVIEDPKTTATRLEKALAMDQALTAKVLRIANSPFYGAVREIRTVSEAIVRLGFVSIRNWTVVTATKSVFLAPGAGTLYKKIWRQSVMSAMAGQLVAQHLRIGEPENIFIGGLMQNIGQLVLARSHPELFQQILTESEHSGRPYHEVEKQLLGFDHGELGALLIKEWNLSQELEEAVRWHHRFEEPDAGNAKVAAMIALGEEVASCSGVAEGQPLSPAGETEGEAVVAEEAELPPLSPVCRYLGVTHGQYEELKREAAKLQIDPHFFN
jgi:HD-like signal output (HDOD) protein